MSTKPSPTTDYTDVYDEVTSQLMADPTAFADDIVSQTSAASMAPQYLQPLEVADYTDAVATAEPYLTSSWTMDFPIVDALGQPSKGTIAFEFMTPGRRPAVAIKLACASLANRVHAHERVGHGANSTKVFENRTARLGLHTGADGVPSVILYTVHLSPSAPQRADGKVAALVMLAPAGHPVGSGLPGANYQITDTQTGEIIVLPDEGQFNPDKVWTAGGIVEFLTPDQLEGHEVGMAAAASALRTIDRLSLVSEHRAQRDDEVPVEEDSFTEPF